MSNNNRNIMIFVMIPMIFIASTLPTDTKSEKLNKVGPCVNNLCPAEYKCLNNECIKNQISLKNLTEGESVGPCINGLCPGDHVCYDNFCYNANRSVNVS